MEAYSNGELAHERGSIFKGKDGIAFLFRTCGVSQGCGIREGYAAWRLYLRMRRWRVER